MYKPETMCNISFFFEPLPCYCIALGKMPCNSYLATMSILISNLTKKYGEQTAVNAISFSVTEPGIVGFLGPNGAGKSTTMKMITGFLNPDAGEITVCGFSVKDQPIEVKKEIGYLPESNPLYYDMYVREYLEFTAGMYSSFKKQGSVPIKERVKRNIESVGLTPEANKKIGQLSKGYKQRVGLAAALLHEPKVLILDEPTSGLDPNQLVEIRELIKTLGREKTVLLSTHVMQEVEAMCSRVIILNKGQIVADDSLENLRQKGIQKKALKVSFEEALEAEWLNRLPAVLKVEKTASHHWLLQTEDLDSLRRQVLELAASQNLNISSLQVSGGSMEEIFRSLTVLED